MQIGYELYCLIGISNLTKVLCSQTSYSPDRFVEGSLFFFGEQGQGSLVGTNEAVKKTFSYAHHADNQWKWQALEIASLQILP